MDELITRSTTCRNLLNAFARSLADQTGTSTGQRESQRDSDAGRRRQRAPLGRRATEEYRVLQRTLSSLLSDVHDSPSGNLPHVDTTPIDLFIIDFEAVEVSAVIGVLNDLIARLMAQRQQITGDRPP